MKTFEIFRDPSDYAKWIVDLKTRFLSQQVKASLAVNTALIEFYWGLGRDLSQLGNQNKYGAAFFETLSKDLTEELPKVKGLSPTNLKYAKYFYELYSDCFSNRQQLVDDFALENLFMLPWGHHIQIIGKCKGNATKALFYVKEAIRNNWSRAVLLNYIEVDLFEAKGRAISNFKTSLPQPHGDLAQALTKDPYCFDFLSLTEKYTEHELEDALVKNITRFLMELGNGFSFVGRQYRLVVDGDEYFIDLLFYNTRLHAYVVVELKTTKFSPEHLGQLGFCVSAVNHVLKAEGDNPTIGLLICKDKSNITAQYALESTNQPIGISEYQLSKLYPQDFKSSLPTIEEIESQLNGNREMLEELP